MQPENQDFNKYLDDSNTHLTDEAISNYVFINDMFNQDERKFINAHLSSCPLCIDKFDKVFDSCFSVDESLDLSLLYRISEEVQENEEIFENETGAVQVLLKKEESSIVIVFIKMPAALTGKKARISLPDLNIIYRILNLHQSKVYKSYQSSEVEISEVKSILLENLKEKKYTYSTPSRRKTFSPRGLIIAAGVVLAAVFLFLILRNNDSEYVEEGNVRVGVEIPITNDRAALDIEEDTSLSDIVQDTALVVKAEDVQVQNIFSENYVLENLINSIDSGLRMESPSYNEQVNLPISFRWSDAARASRYTLIITDNKNSRKYESNIVGTSVTYSGSLKPGLYYWKIEANGELKGINKFVIN